MTQTLSVTDQLRDELAAAKERVERAEATLGSKALERKGTSAAEKELETATDEVRRLTLAIAASERIDRERAADEAEQHASEQRLAIYQWALGYVEQLDKLAVARQALEEAEAAIRQGFRDCPRADLLSRGVERYIDPDPTVGRVDQHFSETDLDGVLLNIPVVGLGALEPKDLIWDIEDAPKRQYILDHLNNLIAAEREDAAAAEPAVA